MYCSVLGCGEYIHARGYCHKHYQRWKRYGDPTITKYRRDRETHGRTGTSIYNIWLSMRARCYRPSDSNYHKYGAIGITVCGDWDLSFQSFYDWSTSNGYKPDLTIDRIENSGNYEPSNCRWISLIDQQNNRTNNTLISAFGETKTILDWSRDIRCSVTYGALQNRLYRGWNAEWAVAAPSKSTRR